MIPNLFNRGPALPRVAPTTPTMPPTGGPAMAGIAPPRQVAATPAGMAGIPTGPAAPIQRETMQPDYERLAQQLSSAKVTAKQIKFYVKAMPNVPPYRVAIAAATDNLWAEEAKRRGVLTGEKANDDLVWEQHWGFNMGNVASDPLLSQHPDAVQKMVERATQIVREQAAAMQRERAGGPRLQGFNA